jgi:hypothetical protein
MNLTMAPSSREDLHKGTYSGNNMIMTHNAEAQCEGRDGVRINR